MNRRAQRISELLRQEISLLLQRQLRDPRLASLISITRVDTAQDMRQAKVYVSVMGEQARKDEALHGLEAASGYLRKELGNSLPLRHIPSLVFVLDDSLEKGEALLDVMNQFTHENLQEES
jgi:ribosome-binding factor A